MQVGEAPADLAVILAGDLNARIVQRLTELFAQMASEHGDIEGQVVAKQRSVADECQQPAQRVGQRQLSLQIGAAQLVDADRFAVQARRRLDQQFQTLAEDHLAAPDQHRTDAQDVRAARVQAGGFEVDGNDFLGIFRGVQTPVQAAAPT
ncbi:hypothetical protein D3C80_1408740 [compost metagenome]